MTETLQEFVDSRGVELRVDLPAGVIRGVKILGLESRNGRRYLADALADAAPLYEGAKVNVNHPKGRPDAPRDYQDRIGAIQNVQIRASEGLFADFHFNPGHALAEQLAWDAAHSPENVGFSHNVEARTSRRNDHVIVEAILKVQSVDLVADPATTRGLFEAAAPATAPAAPCATGILPVLPPASTTLESITLDDLTRLRPDLVAALAEQHGDRLAILEAEAAQLREAGTVAQRRQRAKALLAEYRLPDPDVSDAAAWTLLGDGFFDSLLAAESETAMRRLVVERAQLVRQAERRGRRSLPLARDQLQVDEAPGRVDGAARFVQAIRAP